MHSCGLLFFWRTRHHEDSDTCSIGYQLLWVCYAWRKGVWICTSPFHTNKFYTIHWYFCKPVWQHTLRDNSAQLEWLMDRLCRVIHRSQHISNVLILYTLPMKPLYGPGQFWIHHTYTNTRCFRRFVKYPNHGRLPNIILHLFFDDSKESNTFVPGLCFAVNLCQHGASNATKDLCAPKWILHFEPDSCASIVVVSSPNTLWRFTCRKTFT